MLSSAELNQELVFSNTLNILNTMLQKDKKAISSLFMHYVPCKRTLAYYDYVVVGEDKPDEDDPATWKLGPLGVINGILLNLTGRMIAYRHTEDEIIQFEEYKKESVNPVV